MQYSSKGLGNRKVSVCPLKHAGVQTLSKYISVPISVCVEVSGEEYAMFCSH